MGSNDLEKVKTHFLNEYRENGGTNPDVQNWDIDLLMMEVKHLKEKRQLEEQIRQMQNNRTTDKPVSTFTVNAVNATKKNAELAKLLGSTIKNALDYYDPPFDIRVIDDESFARDNALVVLAEPGSEDSVVILRDNSGRCDMGGPSKWKDDSLDELGRWV